MNNESSGSELDVTVERLKMKYLERKRVSTEQKAPALSGRHYHGGQQRVVKSPRSRRTTTREMSGYNIALQELFQAVTNPPDRLYSDCSRDDSEEDLSENYICSPLLDTQNHYTETDVTLPSSLARTLGSRETESTVGLAREEEVRGEKGGRGVRQKQSSPVLSPSCPSVMGQVYQEMLHIYQQLQAERLSQLQWSAQLQDRENRLLQQEESRSEEVRQLQEQLSERTRENKRLKSSFNSIKELNDNMKKQLNELSEQNKRLENQFRKVQARLENLQRKYEYSMAQKGRENVCQKAIESKPSKPEKKATSKPAKGSVSPTPLRLLALLLDWILDRQTFPPVAGDSRTAQGQQHTSPVVSLLDRCSKVLPLLVEQLHQSSASPDPSGTLSLIKFIYWSLREIDNSIQPVALSSTLRRLGEEVSRVPTQQQDPSGPLKTRGPPLPPSLYRSLCPHTRLLSSLIILRTVTQADILAQVLDSLHSDLVCVDVRGLFLQYGGVSVLLALLRGGKGGLQTPLDILLQLSTESRYLSEFLSACSTEEFFRTAALLVKNPRLELPLLEKLSIILQKLSKIRKNRRLFELCSLHLLLQEMHRTTDPTLTFLSLNLSSILLNLK
ncbi:coiled-coil domain-containing protein 138 [Oncorhynchus nerka]|uniref:coiled-coil domain-containing protein 138 n=1 Tax=Oncorhynchus nerka TaxID=8023 RepID=UPI0031B89B99